MIKIEKFDNILLKKKKKKKLNVKQVSEEKRSWDDTEREYAYTEMLDRLFIMLKEKNPEALNKKVCKLPPPQISKAAKKSVWTNFVASCEALHRQQEHLIAFFLSELNTTGSLDGNKNLILKGHFNSNIIRSIIMKYITMYVSCNQCKSTDTILTKDPERRTHFVSCCICNTKHYVPTIKSGYHALLKGERTKT